MTTTRPVIADLYCGAGGAARGYHDAGFDVVGFDKAPQPNFPYRFVQADALQVLAVPELLAGFDAVHASPTCQGQARVTDWRGSRDDHDDTLTPTLELLSRVDLPWIVENVPEATDMGMLRADHRLCGTQFGLNVRRHRDFQLGNWSSFQLMQPCRCWRNPRVLPFEHKGERAYADAMGCTWMTAREGRQAVPPVYTRFLGGLLIEHLTAGRAAA